MSAGASPMPPQPRPASVNAGSEGVPNPNTGWHAGWYWETDEAHRLVRLNPGADLPTWLAVDWDAVSASVPAQEPLWQLWASAHECDAAARLRFQMRHQQAWSDALHLPWPAGMTAWQPSPDASGLACTLRGAVRRDADGRFLGFCGVLVPRCQAWGGDPQGADGATESAESTQTRLDEQEALRYALSHDLRAPLRVIDGFARIVKEDYAATLGKLGGDHLDRVLAAAARMNSMIDAVLAQAQLSGEALSRAEVDLSAMAREVLADLLSLRDPMAPTVTVTVADGLLTQADPGLVHRVLENLLGNALKYSAKVAAPSIELGCMPATNPAVYFVRDNGAGFDMQHADKLFGMFQRLHSAKEFPGSGVGLAGVQAIVRRHGGRIWAEAQPGQGACFYFTLMDARQAQGRR